MWNSLLLIFFLELSFSVIHTLGVRRLIRNTKTGEYYSKGEWIPEQKSADDFPSLAAIAELQAKTDLTDAEIVLQLGEEPSREYDVHLRLSKQSRS
jgi:hypothetical protein